jgi:hypothetical protein
MSSPPVLVWTSWSPTNSSPKGTPLCRVVFGPCSSFQIWNAGRDACGFKAVTAERKVILNKMNLGLDDSELIAEVSKSVIGVSVSFDLSSCISIVEVSNSATEGVVGGSGTIEEGVEPNGDWLGNVG